MKVCSTLLCITVKVSVCYVLVVYNPAGPHEALSGPLELQQRKNWSESLNSSELCL